MIEKERKRFPVAGVFQNNIQWLRVACLGFFNVMLGLSKSVQGINGGGGSGSRALMVLPWLTVLGDG